MRPGSRSVAHGYTLIELLVALAVFGLLAAISVRGLGSLADQRAHLRTESRQWRDLATLFAAIESDLAAVLPAAGTAMPLVGGRGGVVADGSLLEFTRSAAATDADPEPPRRIRYLLSGGRIEREAAIAAHPGAPAARRRFGIDPAAVTLSFLDAQGAFHAQWPPSRAVTDPPRAIDVTIEFPGGLRVNRLFVVRG